ncbi:hypothetical protein HDV06_006096 [Boothiomyces sp. JEL0866]|nr:hypothetical protein HDV06_006046 [Boothiomyces sp. JEL0866]KAJ3324838.1 hypothetical protein HDV06_006096 [Boothiomyces sp. JEL0866]
MTMAKPLQHNIHMQDQKSAEMEDHTNLENRIAEKRESKKLVATDQSHDNMIKYLKATPKYVNIIEIFKSPLINMKIFQEIISIIIKPHHHSLLCRLLEIRPGNPQISILWGIIASRWIIADSPRKYYPLLQIFKGHLNLVNPENWISQLDHINGNECVKLLHQLKQADVLTLDICIKALEVVCTKTEKKFQNSIFALLSTFRMNEYSANRVVLALCNAGQVEKCMQLVEKYGSRLKQPTLIQVVRMLLKNHMELLAEQLIPLIKETDKTSQNVILLIYSKTNYEKMINYFNHMDRDAVSLGTVLNANGNDVNIERSLRIYRENCHLKSEAVLNILCMNLARRGYVPQIKEIIKEFDQLGIKPTEHTISQLLLGFNKVKSNQMDYIDFLVENYSIKKGQLYYITLLQIYSDGNPLLFEALEQMQKAGITPQYPALINILKGATALESWELVDNVINKLYKKKINQEHLIFIFEAANASKNLNMLQNLLQYIKRSKLRIDIEMYEHILDCFANQPEIIPDILTTITTEFIPTDHIFNYLLDYNFYYDYKLVRLKQQTFQKLIRKAESNQFEIFCHYNEKYKPNADDYLVVMQAVEGDDLVQVVEMFLETDLEPTTEIKEQISRLKDIKELEGVINLYNEIN